METEQAVRLCKSGNKDAFRDLVTAFSGKALRFSENFTKNRSDAEDIVQEAFIKSWKNISALKDNGSFKSWFFKILTNLCRDKFKKSLTYPLLESETISCPQSEESFKTIEDKDKISKVLAALTDIQRKILLLRDSEGFSYSEIAQILSIPEGTVRSRLSAARENFRKFYTQKEGDSK